MARIRTIKPEFPQSESMGRVSREARLLFVQLWTIVDDYGRTRAASRMLASLLYPYDDDAPTLLPGWLDELEAENCIRRYNVGGSSYLEVCKWSDHQRIDKPSGAKCPPPREDSRALASPPGALVPRARARDLDRDRDRDNDRDNDREGDRGPGGGPGEGPENPDGDPAAPKSPRSPKKATTLLGDDWRPKAKHEALAKELRVDIKRETDAMRDWAASKAERCVDWDARFSNWLRRAQTMAGGARASPTRSRAQEREDRNRQAVEEVNDLLDQAGIA